MTASAPPSQRVLDQLAANLDMAERYMYLTDLLFYLPRCEPNILNQHRSGILPLLESATMLVVLLSLRRCLDSSKDSCGLRAMEKAGRIREFEFSQPCLDRLNTLLDKLIVHTDPRVPVEDVSRIVSLTRGELVYILSDARAAIQLVCEDCGLEAPPRVDTRQIDSVFEPLMDDIHMAAAFRQLRDRAAAGLAIDPADLMRPVRPSD